MNKLFFIITLTLHFMNVSAQLDQTSFFGHRGCRGLFPENSLEAFNKAIELGVDGIEWDVVVSKDKKLIISHEPYLHNAYCLDGDGNEMTSSQGKEINFFELTAEEIQQFDCGTKLHSKYPEQQKVRTYKPTVQEAFEKLALSNITILFEIKSEEPDYGAYQPDPEEYADIIYKEVSSFEFKENIIFMSFDPKILEALHKLLPNFRYVYLTYKPFVSTKKFLKDISFKPYALGMYHPTITKRDINLLHAQNINVFAWTVNKENQAKKLVKFKIDGIITDYPDRIRR